MSPKIDIDALSGILGSISIACWVVVFTPQIVENFRRSSADGLSLLFIIIWLAGDVFNILGAILQKVLPTMIILAIYYTLADIILLGQCLWYRRRSKGIEVLKRGEQSEIDEGAVQDDEAPTETTRLIRNDSLRPSATLFPQISDADRPARHSFSSSIRSHLSNSGGVDATHLSPATPFKPPREPTATPPAAETLKPRSNFSGFLFNSSALILVCAVGVLGWWLTARGPLSHHTSSGRDLEDEDELWPAISFSLSFKPFKLKQNPRISSTTATDSSSAVYFDPWGQAFGYLCAILYLGSRVPQLLLNYRRKSTEGVSLLFFLFACMGNLTYVLSIFAYEPSCARLEGFGASFDGRQSAKSPSAIMRGVGDCRKSEWTADYGRYILVNLSWIIGSAGTLFLDMGVFAQFWWYQGNQAPSSESLQT